MTSKWIIVSIATVLMSFIIQVKTSTLLAQEPAIQPSTAKFQAYPPYPDIWDWTVAPHGIVSDAFSTMMLVDNGDVLYLYYENATHDDNKNIISRASKKQWKSQKRTKASYLRVIPKQFMLFGGQNIMDDVSNINILRNKNNRLKLDDGNTVLPLTEGALIAQNGETRISQLGFEDSRCRWPIEKAFFMNNLNEPRKSRDFVIFKILEKPQTVDVHDCQEYADRTLIIKVKTVGGKILALKDGTFLIDIEPGVLMRFDHDFRTKSKLNDERYFILQRNQSSLLLIDEIMNKQYNDTVQEAFDDLYRYLLNLKKGGNNGH